MRNYKNYLHTLFKRSVARISFAVLFVVLGLSSTAFADVVTEWNAIATTVIVTNEKRAAGAAIVDAAYMHAAMYDAINGINPRFSQFAVVPSNVVAGSSEAAAGAAAAYTVLVHLFPNQKPFLDEKYAQSLAQIPDDQSKTDGIAVGTEVAEKLIKLRAGDGWNAAVSITPGNGPGAWQPTSGAPVTPWMAYMRPFALETPSQFRADGPPALDSDQWSNDYNETKSFGSQNGSARTTEQTVIGLFYTEHTGAQYARIFRDFAAQQSLSLSDNARLFAMLYIAGADSLIAGWDSKYYFAFWRPITAIRAGETDGNPNTVGNPSWTPLAGTPGHPEYPAAHGCLTAAFAETLRSFFGTKKLTVSLTSTVTGTTRTFESTDDLIKEIIDARVFGGMHYRSSVVQGTVLGKKVAHFVTSRYFRPLN